MTATQKTFRVRIDVLESDIERGMRCRCRECPLALAIQRALPGYQVEVYGDMVHLLPPCQTSVADGVVEAWRPVSLPWEARIFIHDYDDQKFVKPFSFVLALSFRGAA